MRQTFYIMNAYSPELLHPNIRQEIHFTIGHTTRLTIVVRLMIRLTVLTTRRTARVTFLNHPRLWRSSK